MDSLVFKSLTLSVLLHLIVFNVFVFTFPVIRSAHKPMFIFLGSILQKQDISELSLNKSNAPAQPELNNFTYKKNNEKNPFFDLFLKKPTEASIYFHTDKLTKKTTFKTPVLEEKEGRQGKNDKPVEAQLTPYIPLRLEDK